MLVLKSKIFPRTITVSFIRNVSKPMNTSGYFFVQIPFKKLHIEFLNTKLNFANFASPQFPIHSEIFISKCYAQNECSDHKAVFHGFYIQARRQLNWNGGGGMDSQYKVQSELLSDQAVFITSPKTSLANYWGGIAPPAPTSVYGPVYI